MLDSDKRALENTVPGTVQVVAPEPDQKFLLKKVRLIINSVNRSHTVHKNC
jgi:hypothetical protein